MIRLLRQSSRLFSTANAQNSYPTYQFAKEIPQETERVHQNLYMALNSAMDIALKTDKTYILIDVVLKYLEKMSNSEEFLDVRKICVKDMELIEFLILPYLNKVL